ncbi:MAG: ABC transporter substrate-binding protein, partial [Deltaproteobacteria bacterium]|nr:ABC transporter substrate-binding protein [Deltaproteobacteria bacterium]
MRRQACSLLVGFGVALTVWLWPAPDLRAAERLRVVYSAISGSFAPIWIAQEAGLFEREGLRTDLIYIATSTIAVPSLISGDSQIMMGGGGAVVLARLGGADINIFATSLPVIVQMLIAPPSIARPADLKGKRVGVTRI